MLLRTSKQDGNLWPVSHNVTVRPVASKVHPLIILREIRMIRDKRHRPQKTSCAASQGRPVGFRKPGKKRETCDFRYIWGFQLVFENKPNIWARKFFKPESPSKHMLRAMARECCNWSQKRWTGRQTNEVYEKTRKSNFWVTTSIKWTFLQDPQTQKN